MAHSLYQTICEVFARSLHEAKGLGYGAWLSPQGLQYPVQDSYYHEVMAKKILGMQWVEGSTLTPAEELGQRGWARLVYDETRIFVDMDAHSRITRLQLSFLKDMAIEHGLDVVADGGRYLYRTKVFESAGKDAATAEAEIEEGVEGEHIHDRLFSQDYTGPRWTYGLRNRPMGMGAQPKGFIIGSGGPAAGRARHGTIQYPRELTKDELYDFELELISGSEVNEAKRRLDSKCWKGYRKKGTKIKSNKRVNNCVKERCSEANL